MKRFYLLLALTLTVGVATIKADESITVSAQSTDISEQLDLRAVATLFAQSKDLEQFERALNNPDSSFTNLDLNGDGQVDYLRVIETNEGLKHLIVLQAVLAKDIYQDVATIYVEKDEASNTVKIQVIGDEYIYGPSYVIEPVFYYRPYIYDWFWGPGWYCYRSPFYWDYWPGWWRPYAPVVINVYNTRCCCYNYAHGRCSYRNGRTIHESVGRMSSGVSQRSYAQSHQSGSYANRPVAQRRESAGSRSVVAARQSSGTATAGSRSSASHASAGSTGRTSSSGSTSRTGYTSSPSRTSGTSYTSSSSRASSAGSHASTGSTSRTSSSSSTSRTSYSSGSSTPSRSSSSYSSTPSRSSSSYSSGSSYSGSRSSSSYSSGSSYSGSSHSSGGGYSGGGFSGGGHSSGGYSGGGHSGGGGHGGGHR